MNVSQWWETKGTNDWSYIGPKMASEWWETKQIKNKHRYNLGWCPNHEKPMEQKIELR